MRGLLLFPVLVLLAACGDTPPPSAPLDDALAPSFGHLDGLPSTPEALVCGFVADLDELLTEFDLAGDFEDARLNRALAKGRSSVVEAREAAMIPQLAEASRHLRGAMRELEKGAALTSVSGTGFADDLASLGSFFAERFTEELIGVASLLGTVAADAISDATSDYEEGVAARDMEEWERSLMHFGQAVRRLERHVVIGTPCG